MAFAPPVRLGPWERGALRRWAKRTPTQLSARGTRSPYPCKTHPGAARAGQVPKLLTSAGFAAALDHGAYHPLARAPWAEGQQSQAPGLAPKIQRNFLFFSDLREREH